MKNLLLLTPLLLAACQATPLYERPGDGNPMNDPEFMAETMEVGMPGDEHDQLARLVGDWNVSGAFYLNPGADPMPTTAKASFKSIMGGRYIIQDYDSNFAGMPYQGMMVMGYDRIRGEYMSIWMDNWNTVPSQSYGEMGESGAIEMETEMVDLMTPDGRMGRSSMEIVSDNEMIFRMWDVMPDRSEWMIMELNYTR